MPAENHRFKIRPIGYKKTDQTAFWGGVYHLSASKNAFEFIVRMKKIAAEVHDCYVLYSPSCRPAICELFVKICLLIKVCRQVARFVLATINRTGDFSKHYELTCKKADHRTDTGELSACRL